MIKSFKPTYSICLLLVVLCCATSVRAQSKKQLQLEEKRQEFKRQIRQFQVLVSQGKQEQKSIVSNVEDLNYKVAVRQNLIRITNQQANLLTREINNNQKNITALRDKLKILKEEYAAMIVKSYKSKSEESKVMFLLSSSNFQQAYKRLQYIKQYADYQKKQSEEIKLQTEKLQALNISLAKQKKDKQLLIAENRKAKTELDKELKQLESLMASVNKDLRKYTSQIKVKQQEVDKIDRQIAKIIRDAIAKSNTKAGKSSKSTTFALTPAEKTLASNFVANKGKLPWPVRRGLIKGHYGVRPSLINKTVPIKNHGIQIATNKGEKVRAVFNGVVQDIMTPKNGNMVIMIKHGNYFTIYKNLSKIFVKKGDRVNTMQDIGEVRTNKASGDAILGFYVWKGLEKQNPAYWIGRK